MISEFYSWRQDYEYVWLGALLRISSMCHIERSERQNEEKIDRSTAEYTLGFLVPTHLT